jgi:DNA polymerase
MASVEEVVQDLAAYLEYERSEGRAEVVLDRAALDAVSGVPSVSVPAPSAPASPEDAEKALREIASRVDACTQCSLHETRTNVVPGQGAAAPEIMFIGEAPGADEDKQGLAFVGRAGKLLTKMIEAMGYAREQVFIGNILKCRPPENRTPMPDEMATCLPYLKEQIAVLKPRVMVALGGTAVKSLFDVQTGITKMRGTWLSFEGIDVMPTYHPAYLLRNPAAKREVWEDLQAVLRHLGRPIPEVKKRG